MGWACGLQKAPLTLVAGLAACLGTLLWAVAAGVFQPVFGLEWSNKDFANYWLAANLALEGKSADLFGPHPAYFAHMQDAFGPDYPWHNWSYPPSYLLTVLPLGFLPYKIAMVAYLLVTFLMLCAALHLGSSRLTILQLLLLAPAIIINVLTAQNGFFTAALLIGGLAARETRPLLAGVLIGMLTIKPQLGFLLPILLLFERRWLVMAAAAGTAIVLAAVSILAFGVSSWLGYFEHVLPYQTEVMNNLRGPFEFMVPSVLGAAKSLHVAPDAAMAVHLVVAAFALVLYCSSIALLRSALARAASTVFAIFFITPYSVTYDLVSLSAAVALWHFTGLGGSPKPIERAEMLLGLAVALLPALTPVIIAMGLPLSPLIIASCWCVMLARNGVFHHFARTGRSLLVRPS